jgi:hypothetical protein
MKAQVAANREVAKAMAEDCHKEVNARVEVHLERMQAFAEGSRS